MLFSHVVSIFLYFGKVFLNYNFQYLFWNTLFHRFGFSLKELLLAISLIFFCPSSISAIFKFFLSLQLYLIVTFFPFLLFLLRHRVRFVCSCVPSRLILISEMTFPFISNSFLNCVSLPFWVWLILTYVIAYISYRISHYFEILGDIVILFVSMSFHHAFIV